MLKTVLLLCWGMSLAIAADDPWAKAELARLKAAHPEWSEPAPVTRRR